MSASWTNKFYKDEIKDIYKPKVVKTNKEEWGDLKKEISLKKMKKGGINMLKAWLKTFLITAIVIAVVLIIVYFLASWIIKVNLN